jgi:hypothetical protein
VVKALEDASFAQPELAALVESYDRKAVDAANAVATAPPEEVPAKLDALEHAFDERAAVIGGHLKR